MAHYYPEEGDDEQKKKRTIWRWPPRRRGFQLRRRQRVKTERLGGKKNKPRRRTVTSALVNMIRKMKMKVKYVCMVKKVKECYKKLVKDMAEAGSSVDIVHHQRLFMETSLAIPIGLTFSGSLYSSRFGPKTVFM